MSAHPPTNGPTSNGGAPAGRPPTDQELMLWVDGELEAARAIEIEPMVHRDPRARAIVAALRMGAESLVSDALDQARARGADSIADGVMAAIEREPRLAPVHPLRAWRRAGVAAAIVSLAAAAGLFMWIRDPSRLYDLENQPATGQMVRKAPTFVESAGVFVDIVDFGARPGAIFYVPSEGESDTAVVWLTEDDSSPASGEMP